MSLWKFVALATQYSAHYEDVRASKRNLRSYVPRRLRATLNMCTSASALNAH